MIIRDADGKICIVNRKDCKNDASFYEKIYEIKNACEKKLQQIVLEKHTSSIEIYNSENSKHFSHNVNHEDEDE